METERLIIDSIRQTDKEAYFYNISHDRKMLETFVCKYAENLEEFDFSGYLTNPALFAIRLKETKGKEERVYLDLTFRSTVPSQASSSGKVAFSPSQRISIRTSGKGRSNRSFTTYWI